MDLGGKRWGKVEGIVDKLNIQRNQRTHMLIGEYRHSIDEKGRLALPAKFRKVLSKGVVVTRGVDRCLSLYPQETWEKLSSKISNLPMNQKNNRAFARLMLAGAMDSNVDGQGRVVLPDYLRSYANLAKNVVIAGVHDRLEIWDQAEWEKYTKDTELHSEDIAETVEFFQNGV